jgi:magnesium-transporting ATPase (P-type)
MLFDIPFSSSRKRATSVIRLPNGDIRVFVKGAPEIVIEMCEKFHAENGAVQNLKSEKKNSIISSEVKNFAKQTFRTLLIAYVDIPAKEWNNMASQNNNFKELSDKEVVESGLTMVGVFALVDPLRPGVADAVDTCHRAGVNVRMCTGDNIDTAIAISRQAHILEDKDLRELEDSEYKHYICMTGKDFREAVGGLISEPSKKNDGTTIESLGNIKTFRKIKDKLKVLARSQPEDKFMLVTGLKQEGAVVAVTGDGNNDAPALIKSDVGFSMGKAGTDVCKNASAIVLTEDDFCSVIVAIKYGRNIYDNVRKFLQFQLTVNVAAMFIVFAGALLLADEALTPVQMLWVNLIMDTLAALALATEPPGDELLNRPPHSRKDKIINATMWRNIIGHAIYQIAVMMVILYYGVTLFNLPNYDKEEPFFVTKFWAEENLDNEN